MERIISKLEDCIIYEADDSVLQELAEFIVKENYSRNLNSLPKNMEQETIAVCDEESGLVHGSLLYIARDFKGELVGSIRVHLWDGYSSLPISKFGISPENSLKKNTPRKIWHVGRFAIKKQSSKHALMLLKRLMMHAIAPIIVCKDDIMLAEVDSKLFFSLRKMGIDIKKLGKPQYHIGSETIPAYANSSDLIHFYRKNHYLLN